MKNNKLTKAVLAALVFASTSVLAASDYPAADFQPKVVFSDESAQSAPESKPAAAAVEEEAEADPKYPATNFQPKVLYKDADYKHSAAVPSAAGSSAKSASATVSAASAELEVIENEKAASSDFSYIGLIALAAIGFVVYSKKSGGQAAVSSAAGDYVAATGATGVEKYLEKMGANKTGVDKYLEKQTANPSTGVAKYMAKQIVKDREAAAARATGVEKYLRDKG
ncbi:hypothetical protein [Methylomonas rivi]|uniref:Uncharacterized protein n=1 Tax=Methylomonas rivi TaxID=2952226 RepID=A0ABT1U422_9GAMM|nr:hypothetical protein [Methylomonas sp. WSC-6]